MSAIYPKLTKGGVAIDDHPMANNLARFANAMDNMTMHVLAEAKATNAPYRETMGCIASIHFRAAALAEAMCVSAVEEPFNREALLQHAREMADYVITSSMREGMLTKGALN